MDTVPRARPRGARLARDDQGRKECCTCRGWHPEPSFCADRNAPDGLYAACRDCQRAGRHKVARSRPRGSALVRDEHGRKQCGGCSKWLPEASYSTNKKALDGLFGHCRDCKRATQQRWAYGLGPADIERLLDEQGHQCAICRDDISGHRYFIDHDHACCDYYRTGSGAPVSKSCGKCVRGLLCRHCNTAVSALKDSPEIIRAAADYVEQFRAAPLVVVA